MARANRTNGRGTAKRGRKTADRAATSPNGNGERDAVSPPTAAPSRLPILKTYKIYIGGKFPRTESGRFYLLKTPTGDPLANVCQCSRKDFRDAVVAARAAQGSWASKTAHNRGQILYRIAEMLEGRAAQFVEELSLTGLAASAARDDVSASIDRLVHYAGWCDKYQQVFSSVNPVASSHFSFSVLEPTGVVAILASENSPLLGLVSVVAPAIAGGNAVVALASTSSPLAAVTFAEVLATSDLPGGVVNLLTGDRRELLEPFASHLDVNACVYCGYDAADLTTIRTKAALNVKRVIAYDRTDWRSDDAQGPYFILDTQEVKTTWHPAGV